MEQDPKEDSKLKATGSDTKDGAANDQSQVTRRRALIAGLAAVPVVMSVMSTSAWGTQPNCSIVASYVNGGNHFTSPQLPGHNVTIGNDDLQRCHL